MIDNKTYRAIFWEIFNAFKKSKNNFVSTKTFNRDRLINLFTTLKHNLPYVNPNDKYSEFINEWVRNHCLGIVSCGAMLKPDTFIRKYQPLTDAEKKLEKSINFYESVPDDQKDQVLALVKYFYGVSATIYDELGL